MHKRRVIWLLIAGLVLVGVLVMVLTREREPEYGGKTLSEWVEIHAVISSGHSPAFTDQAVEAIRNIGTNAMPYLLRWIQYKGPGWETRLNALLEKVSPGLMVSLEQRPSPGSAVLVFRALGPQAEGAIPELTRILNDPKAGVGAQRAAEALGFLGQDALSPLLGVLTNRQAGQLRYDAAQAIEKLGTNARPAVPSLIKCLNDEDEYLGAKLAFILYQLRIEPSLLVPALARVLESPGPHRKLLISGLLGTMNSDAESAVPALVKLLKDSDPAIREAATNAVGQIDPQALERATQ